MGPLRRCWRFFWPLCLSDGSFGWIPQCSNMKQRLELVLILCVDSSPRAFLVRELEGSFRFIFTDGHGWGAID